MKNKVIISCAYRLGPHADYVGCAADHSRGDREQAIAAAEAGAAVLHLHARVPQDGRPTGRSRRLCPLSAVIRQATDAVVNITTGGSALWLFCTASGLLRERFKVCVAWEQTKFGASYSAVRLAREGARPVPHYWDHVMWVWAR